MQFKKYGQNHPRRLLATNVRLTYYIIFLTFQKELRYEKKKKEKKKDDIKLRLKNCKIDRTDQIFANTVPKGKENRSTRPIFKDGQTIAVLKTQNRQYTASTDLYIIT